VRADVEERVRGWPQGNVGIATVVDIVRATRFDPESS
jgi:hypothetical protein